MPDSAPQFTIDRVIELYVKTKDEVDALGKRHAEEMKPFSDRLEACKAWMQDYLNREGLENAKTPHGLAYKSTAMGATVDPDGGWEKLLNYILGESVARALDAVESGTAPVDALQVLLQSPALALLNRAVNKTAVRELLEHGVQVPGVKIAHVTQVNVRRA